MNTAPIAHDPKKLCKSCPFHERSIEHHGLLFSIIRKAFETWPERHEYQPQDAEHLRGWLLIRAGHSVEHMMECDISNKEALSAAMQAVIFMGRAHQSTTPHYEKFITPRGIKVVLPKSINKDVKKRDFEEISRRVFDVIEGVLGVEVETMKRAKEPAS